MALRRVTIQDVADACGLSRNTVSKVFNNRGNVLEPTKQLVIKKALELGYFQLYNNRNAPTELRKKNVVLFTRKMPSDYHFGTVFIPSFTAQLSRAGYTLMINEVSEEELRKTRSVRLDCPLCLSTEAPGSCSHWRTATGSPWRIWRVP